ncbi:adenine deaminase [Vibrio coralliilyticus]|uniref:Adenine deaminase n=1 Tax=Vibrio coralliilyticus TaxID=190893 RepID=A0A1V0I661_9VIBR|nr:adenosine deaminase [Vibrio coralliilyticus]ARC91724.1 adenosine deaminase [Vibrio coralliilyticus]KJY68320.1 adenine deaminase [Vibrio coralliilyticus]NOI76947.1 adenosine deaminase [Vibrio coralliilyticus]NRF14917.1 adenosine deaminase [Vibrio coralliilyticus]PAW01643.1 adenosine deaminase [Vibrio coralliilyticus]
MNQTEFIRQLPKVELHLHIEGSLEPEMMFELALRNQIALPFTTPEEVKAAYEFTNLQSFLDIYYQGANVLIHEQDFYDLTWAYLLRCKADNVIHTEIFFDPQTHTERGIAFDTVINGIHRALQDAKTQLGISSRVIMCFLRHLDEQSAFVTLEQALAHKDKIIGVGLDSSEVGHPPEKFARVFAKALEAGFLTVAHAGEEGPVANIYNSLELLKVSRIDHGVRCADDPNLVVSLAQSRMPLTVCPLSNTKLKVFEEMKQHNVVDLLRQGLCVTINSDDPAYFGGYMTDNFLAVADSHMLTQEELAQFSRNAIEASFISDSEKQRLTSQLDEFVDRC